MAELNIKATLDDSDIKEKLSRVGEHLSTSVNNNLNKVLDDFAKKPKVAKIEAPMSDAAVKTLEQASEALDKLDVKARDAAAKIAQLRTKSQELSQAKAELARHYYSGAIGADEYFKSLSAIERGQRETAVSLQMLNREVKQNIQLESAAAGSLEEARIKLAQMNAEIVKMGGTMDGTNAETDQMILKQQELYKAISAMEQKMGIHTRNVGNYASGWNGLQNSINQLTRELPAFTYSVQTGFMAMSNNFPILVDEINKAAAANKALVAEGKKGIPVWKQVAGAIFSWQTALSVGITLLTVYGKEIGAWVSALFKGKDALADLKRENDEFRKTRLKGTQDAQSEITHMQSLYRAATNAKLAYTERHKAVKALQEQYPNYFNNMTTESILAGKAAAAYNALSKSIIASAQARAYEGKISENASKQLENIEQMVNLQDKLNEAESDYRNKLSKLQSTDPMGNATGYAAVQSAAASAQGKVEMLRAEIDAIGQANGRLEQQNKRYAQNIDQLIMRNGVSVITGDYGKAPRTRVNKKELTEYKNIMDKIGDIDREYARKFLETNEAEIAAVRDKFAEIYKLIDDYNRKNPKVRIDVEQVRNMETKAVTDTEYKQQTDELMASLDEQKSLVDEYYQYASTTSVKRADEAYSKQIDVIKGYKAKLQREYLAIISMQKLASVGAMPGRADELSAVQEARAKEYKKRIDEFEKMEQDLAKRSHDALLEEYGTFQQKRADIIQRTEEKVSEAVRKGLFANVPVIRKQGELALKELSEIEVESLDSVQNLFENMDTLSSHAQSVAVKAARATFEQWIKEANLTSKEVEQLRKVFGRFFDESEKRSLDKMGHDLRALVAEVNTIAGELSRVDEGFARVLGTIGMVVGGVSEITARIKEMRLAQRNGTSDIMQGMSTFLSIYGAFVQAGTGIYNAVNSAAEQRWNDQVMLRTREIEAQNDLLEYQIALVDTLNGTEKLEQMKDNLAATQALITKAREELAGASTISGDSSIDSIIKDLNQGKESVDKLEERIRALRRQYNSLNNSPSSAAQQANIMASISKIEKALEYYRDSLKLTGEESVEELIKLSSQVDEETKKKIDQLIEYERRLKETSAAISESLLGFTSKSMIDEVENLFDRIKFGGKEAAESFEGFMRKAIINSLRVRFIEKSIMELYADMEKKADENLSAAEASNITDPALFSEEDIKNFQDRYTAIVENGQKKLEAWEKATGLTLTGEPSSSLSSGGIARTITESTGSELLGIYRAIYEIENKNLSAVLETNNTITSLLAMSSDHLVALNSINVNTANTVQRLDTAVGHLAQLVKNTSQQSTRAYTG